MYDKVGFGILGTRCVEDRLLFLLNLPILSQHILLNYEEFTMKNNKKKRGFTIIELVIVIAVIAILAGVLIPTFSSVIEKANKSARLQTATQALTAALTTQKDGALKDGTIIEVDGYRFTYTAGKLGEEVKNNESTVAPTNMIVIVYGATDKTLDSTATEYKFADMPKNAKVYIDKTDFEQIDGLTITPSTGA